MKKNRILVVDDEIINRKILNKILSDKYDVIEAVNGKEALDIVSKQNVAAVILDLHMPVMDGYEFLDRIEELKLISLPILVVTSEKDDEVADILTKGAWDYVVKPYNSKVLKFRLENIMQRSEISIYKEMERLIAHDQLTGLHNRNRLFMKSKDMILNYPDKHFIFLKIDIDRFALFNTSFGEKEGDKLIIFLANILKEESKKFELYEYGRIGADIFGICAEYTGKKDILINAIDHVRDSFKNYKKNYMLEFSCGIYEINDSKLSIEEAYQRASLAASKCKGIYGQYFNFFDENLLKANENELWINNEMEKALDNHDFVVYLQPKMNLSNNLCSGAEALVRWIHPTRGLISPGVFIPVFESNGFIAKLDYYIWEQTCILLQSWSQKYQRPYPVSVNISRISLYNPNLVDDIVKLINKYEIDSNLLQLEITESAYMSNQDLMEETITRLKLAGFTILMDDFGSGYSSLNTLKEIDVDILKIDMKFLSSSGVSSKGEIILSSIIKMANWLGMGTIVEGVETRTQRDFVEGSGCNYIQGYYFSKPIPIEEFVSKYYIVKTDEIVVKKKKVSADKVLLVIDDDESVRSLLYEYFHNDYHVVLFNNAEEGVLYLRRNFMDVYCILIDNIMDYMSGMQFLELCKDDVNLNDIPKVMITAFDNDDDKIKAFELGAYDFLTKPFIKEVVIARIKRIMDLNIRFKNIFNWNVKEIDSLTGVLEKLCFERNVSNYINEHPNDLYCLFILDIDNFKTMNDEYGHLLGDKILKLVGKELIKNFRVDDYIGRFGGDEFVMLMTQLPNKEIAIQKANSIITSLSATASKSLHINLNSSIGLAFNDEPYNFVQLFERADKALYEAKNSGKNRSNVYGEQASKLDDNSKPIILICGDEPNIYPEIALYFNDDFIFKSIYSFEDFKDYNEKHTDQIIMYLLNMDLTDLEFNNYYNFISNNEDKHIPVIAISQESNLTLIKKAINLDIDDIITWPLQKDVVKRKVFRLLNN